MNDADIVDAVDDFLMHFGVMGMKWGIRNSNALTRTLDEDRQKQVFKARVHVKGGKTRADYRDAKASYSVNKIKLGKQEAKKILDKAKTKKITEIRLSRQLANKNERLTKIILLSGIGAYVLSNIISYNVLVTKAIHSSDETEEFLEHFGIMGMHWGIRNDKEKAQKYVDKAKSYQTQINAAKSSRKSYSYIQKLEVRKQRAETNVQRKLKGKLSLGQRNVVIGAGAAAAILAAYGTYHSVESGNARRLVEMGKNFVLQRHGSQWKTDSTLSNKDLNADQILDKVVSKINPNYGSPGTKQNCKRTTYAYEMRRRGYDVAATKTLTGMGQDYSGTYNSTNPGVNHLPSGISGLRMRLFSERNKPQKPITEAAREAITNPSIAFGKNKIDPGDVYNRFKKQPVGARGELSFNWLSGGGHSVSWENIKGKPVLFDNQTGKSYRTVNEINKLMGNAQVAAYTRLDNIPLNEDFLRRWVKNA